MKLFTLLLSASALALAQAATAQTATFKNRHADILRRGTSATFIRSAISAGLLPAPADGVQTKTVWLPQTERFYSYDNGKWIADTQTAFTYDAQGNVTTALTDDGSTKTRETYTYDGLTTSKVTEICEEGETDFLPSEKKVTTRDSRVSDFVVKTYTYTWDGVESDWSLQGNNWERPVSRDANGNVTSIVISTFYQGGFTPSERTDITYGDDGRAATFTNKQLDPYSDEDPWIMKSDYRNLKWRQTDGQLVYNFTTYYEREGRVPQANQLKSADVYENDKLVAHIDVAYTEGKDDYTATTTYTDGSRKDVYTFTVTDANGSVEVHDISYEDLNGDGLFTDDEKGDAYYVATYDEHGKQTFFASYSSDDYGKAPTLEGGQRNSYVYDSNGTCTQEIAENITPSEKDGSPVYEKLYKLEFADFVAVDLTSGIATAPTAATAAPHVYDLSGRLRGTSTDGLPAGIYIVRTASGTRKVYVGQ